MGSSSLSKKYNYDETFIREVSLAVIGEFYRKIRWINVWEDKESLITVPVYYGLGGDSRYLLDAFIDDIVGKRPDLNIDPIPRAHITIENASVKKDEISNPNVYIEYEKIEDDGTLKRLKSKMQVLPIQINYNLEIRLNTEIDVWKATQSIWDWLWRYKYFYISYKSIRINCVYSIPDDYQNEIQRQIDMTPNNTIKKINFQFSVHTEYYVPNKEQEPIIITKNKCKIFGEIHSLDDLTDDRYFVGSKK